MNRLISDAPVLRCSARRMFIHRDGQVRSTAPLANRLRALEKKVEANPPTLPCTSPGEGGTLTERKRSKLPAALHSASAQNAVLQSSEGGSFSTLNRHRGFRLPTTPAPSIPSSNIVQPGMCGSGSKHITLNYTTNKDIRKQGGSHLPLYTPAPKFRGAKKSSNFPRVARRTTSLIQRRGKLELTTAHPSTNVRSRRASRFSKQTGESQLASPNTPPLVQKPSYPVGRPWRPTPVKPIRHNQNPPDIAFVSEASQEFGGGESSGGTRNQKYLRRDLLHALSAAESAAVAWRAYSGLVALNGPSIPMPHMHRLARVLSSNRPKTRKQFTRLLSVLSAIQKAGGKIHLHEWNALIDHAGKGLRKTKPEEFRRALDIFTDMVSGRAPGSTMHGNEEEDDGFHRGPIVPDIYTYSTLINIAARTLHGPSVHQASSLLQASGLPPNRITHLSLLRYFTKTKHMSGIRATLLKMRQQGHELGLDGLNACIWAYSHNERSDMVMKIYRLLRHNVTPESGNGDLEDVIRELKEVEFITIPGDVVANEVTFTIVIQTLAYQGNLLATLSVFADMLSSKNVEWGAPLVRDEDGGWKPTSYSPTLPVFRAIFLGFSRHVVSPEEEASFRLQSSATTRQPRWSLENLQDLFGTFLMLPDRVRPNQSIVYWILDAFDKASGHDADLLRQVWVEMETRFGPWGRGHCYFQNRLRQWHASLFPEERSR